MLCVGERHKSCSSRAFHASFLQLLLFILLLGSQGLGQTPPPLSSCPVSVYYAVSLGVASQQNKQLETVPIFQGFLDITNNDNVSSYSPCFISQAFYSRNFTKLQTFLAIVGLNFVQVYLVYITQPLQG